MPCSCFGVHTKSGVVPICRREMSAPWRARDRSPGGRRSRVRAAACSKWSTPSRGACVEGSWMKLPRKCTPRIAQNSVGDGAEFTTTRTRRRGAGSPSDVCIASTRPPSPVTSVTSDQSPSANVWSVVAAGAARTEDAASRRASMTANAFGTRPPCARAPCRVKQIEPQQPPRFRGRRRRYSGAPRTTRSTR
jgi:hypothetical protein